MTVPPNSHANPVHSRRGLERVDGLVALLPILRERHAGSNSHLPGAFLRGSQLLRRGLAEAAVQVARVSR